MSEKKLSESAIEVLRMLAEKPRETHKDTIFEWVSGATAGGLVRRGLAKYVYLNPMSIWDTSREVHITQAGRDALAEWERRQIGGAE